MIDPVKLFNFLAPRALLLGIPPITQFRRQACFTSLEDFVSLIENFQTIPLFKISERKFTSSSEKENLLSDEVSANKFPLVRYRVTKFPH